MKRDNFPSPVSEVLKRVFSKFGVDKKIEETKVLRLWPEVVGKEINRHTHPFSIRGGNLFVRVDNSGWLVQLSYLKNKIISEFNKRQGQELVKDIYFRLGEIKKSKKEEGKSVLKEKKLKLEKSELDRIKKDLRGVKDRALHQVLRRILIKDKNLKKTL